MNKLCYLLIIAALCACTNNSKTEKHQDERDNVVDVREKVKDIDIKDVMISGMSSPYIIADYLIIKDSKSPVELIHILNKNTFKYITSRVFKGRGPGEIINIGQIGIDEANRALYITDRGKRNIFRYDLDSLLADSRYLPTAKMKIKKGLFPQKYQYINDTLLFGIMIELVGKSDFKPSVAKWNMNTGEVKYMKYQHPEIKKKRISYAASMENGIYVECYSYHDLMTICSLDGDLKYNIYGRNWNTRVTNEVSYFGQILFYKDKIVALYRGRNGLELDENGKMIVTYATKFMVFDLNGDYIKTLETGYKIVSLSLDKENNRFILHLQDTLQFAYLDLDGLID